MAVPSNDFQDMDDATMRELLKALLVQAKTTTNVVGVLMVELKELEADVRNFVKVQTITRDRRFEEEIGSLEDQIAVLSKQLEEKKNAKAVIRTTSDKIKAAIDEKEKANRLDWKSTRQTIVNTIAATLAVAVVWGIITHLPEIGTFLKTFLGR